MTNFASRLEMIFADRALYVSVAGDWLLCQTA